VHDSRDLFWGALLSGSPTRPPTLNLNLSFAFHRFGMFVKYHLSPDSRVHQSFSLPHTVSSSNAISCHLLCTLLPSRIISSHRSLITSYHFSSFHHPTSHLLSHYVSDQTRDDMEHIALMERCIGPFPFSLIDRSKRSKDYFQRCSGSLFVLSLSPQSTTPCPIHLYPLWLIFLCSLSLVTATLLYNIASTIASPSPSFSVLSSCFTLL
jgi:hypothetical protein